MATPRLRFAPSPTGYLHIGGARTALFNWLWARKTGGTFVLRIEDTDQERSTDASRAAILEAMTWLGLDWDEGPFTQMERLPLYAEWAERLIRSGHAYRCYCTKAQLDAQRDAAAGGKPRAKDDRSAGFKYPGTCRDRTDQPDLPHVIRFKVDRAGSVTYVDKVFKETKTPNVELQDFVLLRSDGVPLYNFGCVVDDITMGITLVARGSDHRINTPPQILLYQALGADVPELAHLPMMLAPNGERLSKRHGAVSVTQYRDLGYSPDAVLDYLARFGWSSGEHEVRMTRGELVSAFDWAQCGRVDGKFDPRKFLAVDHHHLQHRTSDVEYAQRVRPFLDARGLPDAPQDQISCALPLIRDRAQTFVEAADLLDPFLREPPAVDELAARRFLTGNGTVLRDLATLFASSTDWTVPALEAQVTAWLAARGQAIGTIGQPLRVALTGRTTSPSLFEVLAILGRDRSLARLERAAEQAT